MPRWTHVCFREKTNWVTFALETSLWQLNVRRGGEGCFSHLAHKHLFVGLEPGNCYGEHNRKGGFKKLIISLFSSPLGGEAVKTVWPQHTDPRFSCCQTLRALGHRGDGAGGENPVQAVMSKRLTLEVLLALVTSLDPQPRHPPSQSGAYQEPSRPRTQGAFLLSLGWKKA